MLQADGVPVHIGVPYTQARIPCHLSICRIEALKCTFYLFFYLTSVLT